MHVMVLDKEHFPQGQVFHHNKPVMKEFVEGTKQPYVFHMCWTASKVGRGRGREGKAMRAVAPVTTTPPTSPTPPVPPTSPPPLRYPPNPQVDKLKYMKQVGMWFLTDTCDEGALRSQSYDTGGCCRTDMVPWRVGDGTEIPSIAS